MNGSSASDSPVRRPLASRSSRWAGWLSRLLAGTSITPNQVSMASIAFAMLAFGTMLLSTRIGSHPLSALCLLVAAAGCQLRLLCNLMDGMLAIEAGRQTRDGAVWNELPDRVADVLILVGAGIAADFVSLGWAAAVLAVSVAYVRELGKGIDGIVDFSGPMAKPHRMALVTAALLLACVLYLVIEVPEPVVIYCLQAVLWVLCAGTLLTLYRRSRTLLRRLAGIQ